MKKRIYLITAISAVAIALTACGGNAGNNKSTGGSTATGSAVSSDTTGAATGASIDRKTCRLQGA